MMPSEEEQARQQYEELNRLCRDMDLDVTQIEMPLHPSRKEACVRLFSEKKTKPWWRFAINI